MAPMSWGLLAAKTRHRGCWAQEDRPPSGPWNLLGGHRLEPAEVEREPRQRQHAQGLVMRKDRAESYKEYWTGGSKGPGRGPRQEGAFQGRLEMKLSI